LTLRDDQLRTGKPYLRGAQFNTTTSGAAACSTGTFITKNFCPSRLGT
jgi:hypothetical protein